jgi:colicin import membrane protein
MIDTIDQDDRFYNFLIKALILHVSIVICVVAIDQFLNLNLFEKKMPISDLKVIQSAVRVDIVAMPKMTVQELKKVTVTAAPPVVAPEPIKEVAKSKETSKVEFKKVAKKVDLSNLLKNISAKTVVKKKVKKRPKINNKQLQNLILEGNKVSKGSSTVGDQVDVSEKSFVSYIQSLPTHVRQFWKLPSYLLEQDLRCRVRVYLAANGKILKAEIFESSGVSEYDSKALDAVKKSDPFPRPTQDIFVRVSSGEVLLGFPL